MSMPPAAFEEETVEGAVRILAIEGELDISTVPELRRRVDATLREGIVSLVIDLSGVRHLDSSGLAELIGAHQRTAERSGKVVIVMSSPSIRRTLEIRGLDALFNLAPSREEAIATVEPQRDER